MEVTLDKLSFFFRWIIPTQVHCTYLPHAYYYFVKPWSKEQYSDNKKKKNTLDNDLFYKLGQTFIMLRGSVLILKLFQTENYG